MNNKVIREGTINSMICDFNKHKMINTDNISDGFHTFGQLYHQRMMLFSVLVNLFPEISWKTTKHEDGEECFGGGWFLVTIDTPEGSYGYHYKMEDWDKFNCPVLEKAKHWDGYTEEHVERLLSLVKMKSWYGMLLSKADRDKLYISQSIREENI